MLWDLRSNFLNVPGQYLLVFEPLKTVFENGIDDFGEVSKVTFFIGMFFEGSFLFLRLKGGNFFGIS